ncbi:MAG TPA: asparaginase [Burkholderiales bacterium]|nr:asparaginase [Burkholderiales bacterium]
MAKPLVCVVGTGGTIASKYDAKLGGHVSAATAEDLVAGVPGIGEVAELRVVEHSNVNSAVMDSPTAFALAATLGKALADEAVHGAVVTHGTATLEETAYLMDLTVATDKPIVFTGAQRNFDEPDPDGPRNILHAVKIAASPEARGRGVMVALAGAIFPAWDVTKTHTEDTSCFGGRDGGPIGMVSKRAVTFFARPDLRIQLDAQRIEENVQLIRMPQGGNDLLLRACISARVAGIVVEASAGGNVTVPFYEAICDALAAGIPVVVATRVASGPTHFGKAYRGSLASLTAKGAIAAGYLSGLKARILLMVALGVTKDRKQLADIFARAGGIP